MRKKLLVCLFLPAFMLSVQAQEEVSHLSYYVGTFGSVSSGGQTPFWMVGNQYGIVPLDANNGLLRTQMGYHHFFHRDWSWVTKVDLVAVAPRYRNIYVHQLYTELAFRGVRLSIGSHETGKYLQTVTDPYLSSGDLGLATNARPIPEINLYSPDFIVLPLTGGWLQGKANFSAGRSFDTDYIESFIGKNQYYIQNPLWHHKSLYLRFKDTKNDFPLSFIAGIRHAAQWGGEATDPNLKGKQPHTFKDFLHVVLRQAGDETASPSDQINLLGAHQGTYDFRLGYEKKDWAIYGYYQHIFSDASGMEFINALDGLKGVQIDLPKTPWLSKIVFEHLNTLNQSGPFHFIWFDDDNYPGYGGGADNYYNNDEYTTGFSYFNRSLGTPFLLSPEYNRDGKLGFKHTRIQAWYLGAEGDITPNLSWRLRLSAMESFGTPYAPPLKKLTATSFITNFSYCRKDWTFTSSIAADHGPLLGNHWGFSISVAKQGISELK
jgi:hypothetical protein